MSKSSKKTDSFVASEHTASGQFPSVFWDLLARFLLLQNSDPDAVKEKVFAEAHTALWERFLAKLLPDWELFSFPTITFRGWWPDAFPAYKHLQPASVEFEWKKLGLRIKQTWVPLFPKEGDYNEVVPERELEIWHEHKTTNLLGYVRGSEAISKLLRSLTEKSPCPAELKREYDTLSAIRLGSLDAFEGISCGVYLKRPFVPKYFFKPDENVSPASIKGISPAPSLPVGSRWLVCKTGDSPQKAESQGRETAFPESEIAVLRLLTDDLTQIRLKNGEEWYAALPFAACLSQLALKNRG